MRTRYAGGVSIKTYELKMEDIVRKIFKALSILISTKWE